MYLNIAVVLSRQSSFGEILSPGAPNAEVMDVLGIEKKDTSCRQLSELPGSEGPGELSEGYICIYMTHIDIDTV